VLLHRNIVANLVQCEGMTGADLSDASSGVTIATGRSKERSTY